MNIGKIICLLLIIPLCCGCNEHETSSAPSFRQCFIEVYYSGGLELPMLQTGYFGTQPTVPPQNLQTGFVITPNYSHNNMCDSFSDPEVFARTVQEAVSVPVYDINSLIAYAAFCVRRNQWV